MAVVSEGCETPQRRAARVNELRAQRQEVIDLLHLHDYRLPFAEARKRHSPGHLRRWL
jgi:hypothetical protein